MATSPIGSPFRTIRTDSGTTPADPFGAPATSTAYPAATGTITAELIRAVQEPACGTGKLFRPGTSLCREAPSIDTALSFTDKAQAYLFMTPEKVKLCRDFNFLYGRLDGMCRRLSLGLQGQFIDLFSSIAEAEGIQNVPETVRIQLMIAGDIESSGGTIDARLKKRIAARAQMVYNLLAEIAEMAKLEQTPEVRSKIQVKKAAVLAAVSELCPIEDAETREAIAQADAACLELTKRFEEHEDTRDDWLKWIWTVPFGGIITFFVHLYRSGKLFDHWNATKSVWGKMRKTGVRNWIKSAFWASVALTSGYTGEKKPEPDPWSTPWFSNFQVPLFYDYEDEVSDPESTAPAGDPWYDPVTSTPASMSATTATPALALARVEEDKLSAVDDDLLDLPPRERAKRESDRLRKEAGAAIEFSRRATGVMARAGGFVENPSISQFIQKIPQAIQNAHLTEMITRALIQASNSRDPNMRRFIRTLVGRSAIGDRVNQAVLGQLVTGEGMHRFYLSILDENQRIAIEARVNQMMVQAHELIDAIAEKKSQMELYGLRRHLHQTLDGATKIIGDLAAMRNQLHETVEAQYNGAIPRAWQDAFAKSEGYARDLNKTIGDLAAQVKDATKGGNTDRWVRELNILAGYDPACLNKSLAFAARLNRDIAAKNGVEIRIDDNIPELHIPADRRFVLTSIFREIMENAAQSPDPNSKERFIDVSFTQEGDELVLQFRDNGTGFTANIAAPQYGGKGYGLFNMMWQAKRYGILPKIETAPGEGTKIRLVINTKWPPIEPDQGTPPEGTDTDQTPPAGGTLVGGGMEPANVGASSLQNKMAKTSLVERMIQSGRASRTAIFVPSTASSTQSTQNVVYNVFAGAANTLVNGMRAFAFVRPIPVLVR